MARQKKAGGERNGSAANLGFEAKLWLTADKLRNNMDAAEYKHVVLGLIFLKYISDTFEALHTKLAAGAGDYAGANPESLLKSQIPANMNLCGSIASAAFLLALIALSLAIFSAQSIKLFRYGRGLRLTGGAPQTAELPL